MKKTFLISLLSVLVLAGCSDSSTVITNVDGPAECATQAKIFYDNYQYGVAGLTYQYQNHYNTKLNKCFVVMRASGIGGLGDVLRQDNILWDIYENKSITQCEYTSDGIYDFCGFPGESENEKYNLDKFNNFIKTYMEG